MTERRYDSGQLVHELASLPPGSERVDAYLSRRFPGVDWKLVCDLNLLEVRDYRNTAGVFDGVRWSIRYWTGSEWERAGDLLPGERPRMFETFCYITPAPASSA